MRPAPLSAAAPVSIIIPTLNEARELPGLLAELPLVAPGAEVVVADGGSEDGTEAAALRGGARVVHAPHGRARQMNAGAAAARGEVLLFLHADTRLPPGALDAVRGLLRDGRAGGGCFRLRIPRPEPIYRISDRLGNLGVDLFRIALGDHAIFCRRDLFEQVGGYPDVPLMEDAELYRRLRRHGVRQLPLAVETSPRRYQRHGPYRTTAVYAVILAGYAAGVPVERLLRIYRRLAG